MSLKKIEIDGNEIYVETDKIDIKKTGIIIPEDNLEDTIKLPIINENTNEDNNE